MPGGTSVRTATPALLEARLADVRASLGDREVVPLIVGVRARPQWGARTQRFGGHDTRVEPCATPLAVRAALERFRNEQPSASTLVVLTDLSEAELGDDLLGRLYKPSLVSLNPWAAVRLRFNARRLDPGFGDDGLAWMADALLAIPLDGPAPPRAVLGVEAALDLLARATLGAEGLSLEQILVATAQPGFDGLVARGETETVAGLCATLGRQGPAAAMVMGAIASGGGAAVLPAGLAAAGLEDAGDDHLAIGRIETLTGVSRPLWPAIDAWTRAAEAAFATLSDPLAGQVAAEGDRISDDWRVPDRTASSVLPGAFEARLEALARDLDSALDGPTGFDPGSIREAVEYVRAHRLARSEAGGTRSKRAQLAARLVAWLTQRNLVGDDASSDATPPSLNALIDDYLRDGSWVDRARRRVGEGDGAPRRYSTVLKRISDEAHAVRSVDDERFARSLARWTHQGTAADLARPVWALESVLGEVVVPLAKARGVLLIVLDGCGLAQFRELAGQFPAHGLTEIGPAKADEAGRRQVGLTPLPTVTAVSRTSLLSGRLVVGSQDDEKRNLPAHPKVAQLPGESALVFHRGDLTGGSGTALPDRVSAALGTAGPKLVAAVVNTIDDELSRGTFSRAYRIEDLDPLAALLRGAVDGERIVVVTADHGHVLGEGLDGAGDVVIGGEGGERWRVATRPPAAAEVQLAGPRVLEGGDAGILAPWGEDLRYSAKHGGYHGGATPAETLVPLSVFGPVGGEAPRGYAVLAEASPAWWDLAVGTGDRSTAAADGDSPKRPKRGVKAPSKDQAALFDAAVDASAPATVGSAAPPARGVPLPEPDWMADLEASDVFRRQLSAASRVPFNSEEIRTILAVVSARGGTASFAVVAAALDRPAGRMPGMMSRLATILNVDGFGVLTVDASAQEVRLNEDLLSDQFVNGPA